MNKVNCLLIFLWNAFGIEHTLCPLVRLHKRTYDNFFCFYTNVLFSFAYLGCSEETWYEASKALQILN